jgi:hypothetical protein
MNPPSCSFKKGSQKWVFLSLTISLFINPLSFSSGIDTTSIVVVGTVHNGTERFTNDSLFNIIKRVHPDLILMELDSSFFTPSMTLKSEFQQITLETSVLTKYMNSNKVMIRPYEIEGRNKIYQDNKYFEQQKELSKALNQATRHNLIQGESKLLFEAIIRFDDITQAFASDFPNVINSYSCSVVMDSKQYYANEGMIKIVASIPSLNQFISFATFKRDFWVKRNETMVKKIIGWKNLLQPKIILILCGFEHKYYLINSLKNQSIANNFKLREYWTF